MQLGWYSACLAYTKLWAVSLAWDLVVPTSNSSTSQENQKFKILLSYIMSSRTKPKPK